MKMLVGFFKNEFEDIVNTLYDIAINSCGRYELVKQKDLKPIDLVEEMIISYYM